MRWSSRDSGSWRRRPRVHSPCRSLYSHQITEAGTEYLRWRKADRPFPGPRRRPCRKTDCASCHSKRRFTLVMGVAISTSCCACLRTDAAMRSTNARSSPTYMASATCAAAASAAALPMRRISRASKGRGVPVRSASRVLEACSRLFRNIGTAHVWPAQECAISESEIDLNNRSRQVHF